MWQDDCEDSPLCSSEKKLTWSLQLVESIVADMSKDHKDQFHVVRLNGFIHTDDKLALREIWRQLGKEMEVEDELVSKVRNILRRLIPMNVLTLADKQLRRHHGLSPSAAVPSIRNCGRP